MDTLSKANLICQTIDNGILLLNENLEVLFWNKWLETRTNIPFKEIFNKKITQFYPDINEAKLKRKIKATLALNSSTYYTTQLNESLFNIEFKNKITHSVFKNMQQNVTLNPYDLEKKLVIVYVYDSTILKETNFKLSHAKEKIENEHTNTLKIKQQLETSIEEFELLLNATMEAIVLFDEEYKCININDVGVELFAFSSKEEALSLNILEFFEDDRLNYKKLENTFEASMKTVVKTTFPALIKIKDATQNKKKIKILTVVDLTELKYRDKLISEQAKLVAMGEMIGNIAHQWRQPLSAISTAASGIKLQKEFNLLTNELLNESLDGIVRSSMHLSQTINDFRDFIQGDKEMVSFDLEENLRKDLSIVEGMLKNHDIKVFLTCQKKIELFNYKNELTQAVLNLIDNAKDAFLEKNVKDKYIFINTYETSTQAVIEIYDNAKGIPIDIMNKIFEPYFTTKHKSQGTGLGLYMTHQIIEKSMDGNIKAENISFEHNNNTFNGTCFKVTLPL
ncbi:MAG: HAMP domain-containing sensor histidine kinase [Arcobacteraceae bacterium]